MAEQNAESTNRERIARLDLGEAVTTALRELIFDGTFEQGARLVETELAERFGTSRGPVRDALTDLENAGLVVSGERRGTYVRILTTEDVDELYTLRHALETLAGRRAAQRADPATLAVLEQALADMHQALANGDPVEASRADMTFHRTIVETADHSRLLFAWERLGDQTRLLIQGLTDLPPISRDAVLSHDDILDAMRAGESTAAEHAIGEHLDRARRTVIAQVAASQSGV